ncbi:SIK2 kinase, partial [Prunella himalayana]|nr:SIK2 kinase [Prunella himalayana]
DFGFGNFYKSGEPLTTWCGSPPYAAPEVFEGQQYEGPQLDIWIWNLFDFLLSCRQVVPLQVSFLSAIKPFSPAWNWSYLPRWLLNVPSRWILERNKLLQELPGWMNGGETPQMGVKHTKIGVKHTQMGVKHTKIGVKHTQMGVKHTKIGVKHTEIGRLKSHRSSFPVEQRVDARQRRPSTIAEQTVAKAQAVVPSVNLHSQNPRLLQSPGLPSASGAETFSFPPSSCQGEAAFMEEERVETPKV